MTNKTGTLYVATSPSGRRYVGITTQPVRRRWAGHVRDARAGGRTRLSKAIRKYGADQFQIRVLLHADWGYLNELEPRAIEAYGARSPHGYNLREGGSQSRPHTESRAKMRAAKIGTRHSETTKRKMRESHRANGGRPYSTGMLGKRHSEETKEKMRQAALRRLAS